MKDTGSGKGKRPRDGSEANFVPQNRFAVLPRGPVSAFHAPVIRHQQLAREHLAHPAQHIMYFAQLPIPPLPSREFRPLVTHALPSPFSAHVMHSNGMIKEVQQHHHDRSKPFQRDSDPAAIADTAVIREGFRYNANPGHETTLKRHKLMSRVDAEGSQSCMSCRRTKPFQDFDNCTRVPHNEHVTMKKRTCRSCLAKRAAKRRQKYLEAATAKQQRETQGVTMNRAFPGNDDGGANQVPGNQQREAPDTDRAARVERILREFDEIHSGPITT